MVYERACINNTKISSEIRKNNFTAGNKMIVSVGENGLETEYIVKNDKSEPSFSYYDFVVCDAVYTIYENKSENSKKGISVSLGEIMRTMSGNKKQTLTASKKKKLRESIKKLSETYVYIKLSEEIKARKIENCNEYIHGKILPLEPVAEDDGESVRYRLTGNMPLFDYAKRVRQIITFPVGMLKTEHSDTDEMMMIKREIISHLEILRNTNNNFTQRTISYYNRGSGGIMKKIGIERSDFSTKSAWNKKIRSVNKAVTDILERYKKVGYISDYTVKTEGRNVTGVTLGDKNGNIFLKEPFDIDWDNV